MYSLVGVDGNAFALMGYTAKAMRRAGFTEAEIKGMYAEAESGDYYNLIAVCDDYVNKVNEKLGLTEEDDEDDGEW